MFRRLLTSFVLITSAIGLAAAANSSSSPTKLTAAEIVEKNVAARGGVQAWRGVESLRMEGKMGAGGNRRDVVPVPVTRRPGQKFNQETLPQRPTEEVQLPFVLELKRPRSMRLEIQFKGDTAIQVYDGANGWKLRPFLNRREVESYTPDEIKLASVQGELDGPLVDYVAKGTKIELDGTEKIDDRDTYKLKLTLKNGYVTHVWVDAKTFLETKIEGQPRRLDGVYHPVEVYYRDYRAVNGLQIPFVLETKVVPVSTRGITSRPFPVEKIALDKVVVNARLDPSMFSKAGILIASNTKK